MNYLKLRKLLMQFQLFILTAVLMLSCTTNTAQTSSPPENIQQITLPNGYVRVEADSNSYAAFLRQLPLKTSDNTVYLYNGEPKANQSAQFAVLTIDAGKRDLQQCADAVMRLRAEYLYQKQDFDNIHFNFLSDSKPRYYTKYAGTDLSYKKFRKYMDYIFAYANTRSLFHELLPVENFEQLLIGDVLIQTGRPYGHAVTVMDLAENPESGARIFLLSQSYMPAQDIHILNNPMNVQLSPWYKVNTDDDIVTPEWRFYPKDLKRFE